jgi:UDP-GlcNAc3NAcA epimerase
MKILAVVGARPQFIKAAAISRRVAQTPGIEEVLLHTGQHYDDNMSDLFFRQLEIPAPTYHLCIGSGSHGVQTGRMLEALDAILLDERPDWVLVYGDTNSTLAGALSAVKLHVPVAHVEAGLRSFNRAMPEEINRIMADHAADLLFPPTEAAVQHLHDEGVPARKIRQVGDVMYDSALFFGGQSDRKSTILTELGLNSRGFVLSTIHRAENTDDPRRLSAIIAGLGEVGEEIPVVLPLHPRTRAALSSLGMESLPAGVRPIDPVGYLDMVALERYAAAVATDSGGVQKEAFFFRIPCVTLRTETEWTELVALGWNRVVPPDDPAVVADSIRAAIHSKGEAGEPYGDGTAATKILQALVDWHNAR